MEESVKREILLRTGRPIRKKTGESHARKSICEGSKVTARGKKWRVGNDNLALFWTERWMSDIPLIEEAEVDLNPEVLKGR